MTLQIQDIAQVQERPIDPAILDDILTRYNLNWEVNMEPTFLNCGRPTGKMAAVRSDNRTVFDSFSKQYKPIQNRDIMTTALQIQDLTGCEIEKVQSMKEGAIQCITLKGRDFEIEYPQRGDIISEKMLIANSHDGSRSCTVSFGHIVLSCTNGMTRFDKKGSVTIIHTASGLKRLRAALKGMNKVVGTSEQMIESYHKMLNVNVGKEHIERVFEMVLDVNLNANQAEYSTKKQNQVKTLWQSISSEMSYKGQNAFGLLQGVTHYTSKQVDNDTSDTDTKLRSKFFGTNAKRDLSVWEMLSSL